MPSKATATQSRPLRPTAFHEQRDRQQNEKAGAETEDAERDRIGRMDHEARGAAGNAAYSTRCHRRKNADLLSGHNQAFKNDHRIA